MVRDRVSLMELIDDRAEALLLVLAVVLANPVIDDDRIVERVADDGQEGGDNRQVDFPTGDREGAERDQHIVQQGNNGADRIAQFESPGDIDQDADHGVEQSTGDLSRAGPCRPAARPSPPGGYQPCHHRRPRSGCRKSSRRGPSPWCFPGHGSGTRWRHRRNAGRRPNRGPDEARLSLILAASVSSTNLT